MKSAEEFAIEYYQLPQSKVESVRIMSAIRFAEKYHEYAAQQKSEWVPEKQEIVKALYDAAQHNVTGEGYTILYEFDVAADAILKLLNKQPSPPKK